MREQELDQLPSEEKLDILYHMVCWMKSTSDEERRPHEDFLDDVFEL